MPRNVGSDANIPRRRLAYKALHCPTSEDVSKYVANLEALIVVKKGQLNVRAGGSSIGASLVSPYSWALIPF
jgi:hypothetical protein